MAAFVALNQTRIRNVERYLGPPDGKDFYVTLPLTEISSKQMKAAGFTELPSEGDRILPAIVGPITKLNAEGSWAIRKDKPKEIRYIRTIVWHWKTWDGEEHSEFKDQNRECYQRDPIPPPSIEICCIKINEQLVLSAGPFEHKLESLHKTRHVINIFLELFKRCKLVQVIADSIIKSVVETQLNWRLLPPGDYPWETFSALISEKIKKTKHETHVVIMDRQATIESYGPDAKAVGQAGFLDYVAYIFKSRSLVVLESLQRDNAIYMLGENWEVLSKMSKSQLLHGSLHQARIVHSKGWKERLRQEMNISRV